MKNAIGKAQIRFENISCRGGQEPAPWRLRLPEVPPDAAGAGPKEGPPRRRPARDGAAVSTPERWLHEVWEQLTARGFGIDEPAPGRCQVFFRDLRSAQCELDLLVTGTMVWEYLPLDGISPDRAARLALALLEYSGPPGRGLPEATDPAGLTPAGAAGRLLAAHGMTVRVADAGYDDADRAGVTVITSPARPGRGHVRISDEGAIRWECQSAQPVSPAGLAPADIAQALAAALAGHTLTGPGRTPGAALGQTAAR